LQLQKWRDRYQAGTTAKQRGVASAGMGRAAEQLAHAERGARELRMKIRTAEADDLRHLETNPTQLASPGPDWVLCINKAGGLRFGGKQYNNGQQIEPSELAGALNADHLLASGYVRWRPKSALKGVEPKPVALVQPIPAGPTRNPVDVFVDEIERIVAERKCNVVDAFDFADASLQKRALKAYSDMPKVIASGGWGSGGGQPTQSGVGTFRRISDGFVEHVLTTIADRKKRAA
jgi:hypothetical protein